METLGQKKSLFFSFCLYGVLPAVLSGFLYLKQSSDFVIHSPFSYFLELSVAYLLLLSLSGVLFTMLKKLKFEHIYGPLMLGFFGLSFLGDANTLGYKMLSGNIKYLNLKSNKLVLDKRYNCLECKFQINKDDIVYTTSNVVGIVVGKPNDVVTVTEKKMGRGIASTSEVTLGPKELALLTQGGKAIRRIQETELKGKFLSK